MIRAMASQRVSRVRAAAFLRAALNLAKAFSTGVEVGTVGRKEQQPGSGGHARRGLGREAGASVAEDTTQCVAG
jgi:hypothetical protein